MGKCMPEMLSSDDAAQLLILSGMYACRQAIGLAMQKLVEEDLYFCEVRTGGCAAANQ